jgi:hypothetical protein
MDGGTIALIIWNTQKWYNISALAEEPLLIRTLHHDSE